ncbi:Ku protein [Streptomyces roseoverticillatus]|uniref:Ku protein n=1 Tax=Streptomyces roseoverticillatus TaxID=66429 RepID=A0ABV3IYN0_9ACTN
MAGLQARASPRAGPYVLVEPEELERIAPCRSRAIDASGFVDPARAEAVSSTTAYSLASRGPECRKAHGLLRQAMERTHKAGMAMLTMRGRPYLTAVATGRAGLRAEPKSKVRHPLHWAHEAYAPSKEPRRCGDR